MAILALFFSLLTVAPAQALSDTGTGGVFVPASGRVLDTKYNTGGYNTPMPAGTWRTVKIAGNAGIPDDGSVGAVAVTAVILDTTYGQLRGRPNADTATTLMSIYAGGGATSTSNSSIVALNEDGTLQVMTSTDARLVLDVQGYYTSSDNGTAAGGFVPIAGTRIVDTRSGTGLPKAVVASGDTKTIQVTGTAGVPAGASGVVVTMIAVNKEAKIGTLTPFAYGAAQPKNSFQYQESQDTAMSAQVALSSNGKLSINNSGSSTDLVVDVQGYFTAAGKSGAMFTPAAGRAYDTRAGSNTALGNSETRSIQLAGVAGVPVMGSGITAVVITLTAVHSSDSEGRATVWADGTARPTITSMDYVPGSTRSNTVTVPLGANGKISLYNAGSATEYVIDVQGWYSTPGAPTISCPAPYGAGSWSKTIPSALITCVVTIAAADTSNTDLDVWADNNYSSFTRSQTGTYTANIAIAPSAGSHSITALATGAGESDLRANYEFGLGDWANASIAPTLANGSAVSSTPELDVASSGDKIPGDAAVRFTLKAASGTVVADSGWTGGSWLVPNDVLTPATQYSWSEVIEATSGGSAAASSVTTPSWTFQTTADYTDVTAAEEADISSSSTADSGGPSSVSSTAKQGYQLVACSWGGVKNLLWYNYQGAKGSYKTAVNSAASDWAGAEVHITQTNSSSQANFNVVVANYGNVFSGQAPDFNVCTSGSYLHQLPLRLNSYFLKDYSARWKSMVAAHEFGHNLGLYHVGNSKTKCGTHAMALMNPYDDTRSACGIYGPVAGEVAGIKKKYKTK